MADPKDPNPNPNPPKDPAPIDFSNKTPEELVALAKQQNEELSKLQKDLRTANHEAMTRRQELEKLKDVDPDEYARLKQEQKDREDEAAKKAGEFEKLIAEKDAEIKKTKDSVGDVQRRWDTERISSALIAAAVEHGALPNAVAGAASSQVVRLYLSEFKIDDSGEPVHKTALGESGKPMKASEFLAKEKAGNGANLFASSLKSGSGAGPGGGLQDGDVVKIKKDLPAEQRQEAYRKAKAEGKRVSVVP